MRGKVAVKRHDVDIMRITPAYAGKSGGGGNDRLSRQDHPRLCGEKVIPKIEDGIDFRITPAYAGKSFEITGHNVPNDWITPAYAGKSQTAERG